jgi:hypothetical protein
MCLRIGLVFNMPNVPNIEFKESAQFAKILAHNRRQNNGDAYAAGQQR